MANCYMTRRYTLNIKIKYHYHWFQIQKSIHTLDIHVVSEEVIRYVYCDRLTGAKSHQHCLGIWVWAKSVLTKIWLWSWWTPSLIMVLSIHKFRFHLRTPLLLPSFALAQAHEWQDEQLLDKHMLNSWYKAINLWLCSSVYLAQTGASSLEGFWHTQS